MNTSWRDVLFGFAVCGTIMSAGRDPWWVSLAFVIVMFSTAKPRGAS